METKRLYIVIDLDYYTDDGSEPRNEAERLLTSDEEYSMPGTLIEAWWDADVDDLDGVWVVDGNTASWLITELQRKVDKLEGMVAMLEWESMREDL